MINKLETFTDILTPTLSSIGYAIADTETLQQIFLILTITSLAFTILSRIVRLVIKVWAKTKDALTDGKLTKAELDDIAETIRQEYTAIKESEELAEIINLKEKE